MRDLRYKWFLYRLTKLTHAWRSLIDISILL